MLIESSFWRNFQITYSVNGAGGGGGIWYKLPGPGHPEGGPGLAYVANVLVFLGSILSVDGTNEPFQTNPTSLCDWKTAFLI